MKAVQTAPQGTVGNSAPKDEHTVSRILIITLNKQIFSNIQIVWYTIYFLAVSESSRGRYYSLPERVSVSLYTTFNSCQICLIFMYVEFALINSILFIMQIILFATYCMLYSCRRRDY